MGEIFIARSSINLNIEYLDVPEFFWRNPTLEPFYIMTKEISRYSKPGHGAESETGCIAGITRYLE